MEYFTDNKKLFLKNIKKRQSILIYIYIKDKPYILSLYLYETLYIISIFIRNPIYYLYIYTKPYILSLYTPHQTERKNINNKKNKTLIKKTQKTKILKGGHG